MFNLYFIESSIRGNHTVITILIHNIKNEPVKKLSVTSSCSDATWSEPLKLDTLGQESLAG